MLLLPRKNTCNHDYLIISNQGVLHIVWPYCWLVGNKTIRNLCLISRYKLIANLIQSHDKWFRLARVIRVYLLTLGWVVMLAWVPTEANFSIPSPVSVMLSSSGSFNVMLSSPSLTFPLFNHLSD